MQTSTIVILACLVAVVASAQFEHYPAVDALAAQEVVDTPLHDRSPRTKRGLLLLKKKLLLGALGLKAAKVGAVGVAGALALKSKAGHGHASHGHASHGHASHVHASHASHIHHPTSEIKIHSHDQHHLFEPAHSHVEVHDWSG